MARNRAHVIKLLEVMGDNCTIAYELAKNHQLLLVNEVKLISYHGTRLLADEDEDEDAKKEQLEGSPS